MYFSAGSECSGDISACLKSCDASDSDGVFRAVDIQSISEDRKRQTDSPDYGAVLCVCGYFAAVCGMSGDGYV